MRRLHDRTGWQRVSHRYLFQSPAVLSGRPSLYLAKRAVAANDTWADQADYLKPEQKSNGSWTVLVSRRPRTPDGYRVITVGSDGKIQRYFRVQ